MQAYRQTLAASEMWIRRRIERTGWTEKVTNEDVLRKENEDKQILNAIWQWKHH